MEVSDSDSLTTHRVGRPSRTSYGCVRLILERAETEAKVTGLREGSGRVIARRGGSSVVSGKRGDKKRRSYRPVVEAMEALRLLSNAAQMLPELAVERETMLSSGALAFDSPTVPSATWDAA